VTAASNQKPNPHATWMTVEKKSQILAMQDYCAMMAYKHTDTHNEKSDCWKSVLS